ncbi:hypothetical protein B0H14DRAFT_2568919 [Mycena olivaceomarginata]|nr:hypothetical protein B0H14DRAFT_2568919 [Mycena olivaceomarginata]
MKPRHSCDLEENTALADMFFETDTAVDDPCVDSAGQNLDDDIRKRLRVALLQGHDQSNSHILRVRAAKDMLEPVPIGPGTPRYLVILVRLNGAVKSVISGATYIKPDGDIIKSEPEDTALATRVGGGRKVFASSGSAHASHGNSGHRASHAAHSSSDDGHSMGMEDKNGYRWCDPTNENHCHRCGRRNHFAARCMADMPKEIKTWILDRPGAHERSNAVHETYCDRQDCSCHNISDLEEVEGDQVSHHVGIRYEALL